MIATSFLLFLLADTLQIAHAILSNNLGVGLKPNSAKHPLFLDTWIYNATTATLQSVSASGKCITTPPGAHTKQICAPEWCIAFSPVTIAGKTAAGAGIAFTICPKIGATTTDAAHWNFTHDGRLVSRYKGRPGQDPSAVGLCLAHADTGVIELTKDCSGSSTQWRLDGQSHQLSPVNDPSMCLTAVNTTATSWSKESSTLSCDTDPGRLLPYCNATLDINKRIANIFSFAEVHDFPDDWSRLGFRDGGINNGECLHGFVSGCVDEAQTMCPTTFPNALCTASSFNDTLFHAVGTAIATEGRAIDNIYSNLSRVVGAADRSDMKPHTVCWAPDINPLRHPLWGRAQEVPSEDPLLCGRYAANYVRGMQGADDPGGHPLVRTQSLTHPLTHSLTRATH